MGALATVSADTSQVFKSGASAAVRFASIQAADPGMVDLTTRPTRVTITTAGRYSIVGGGGFSTHHASGRVVAWLRKNGLNIPFGGQCLPVTDAGDLSEFSPKAAVVLDLVPGDYIELMMHQSTGHDQAFNINPWQTGHLIVAQVG